MKEKIRINDITRIAIKPDGTKLPVVDSKFTFLITPSEEDIKNGIPGDHTQCMYCIACRRMHGSEMVYVAREVAYIELRNRHGKPELHRFILSNPARVKIKDFDASKHVPPHSVVFAAPTGSLTLEAQSRKYQLRKARGDFDYKKAHQKAHIVGEYTTKNHDIHPLDTLRDPATGRFQFKKFHHSAK